MIRIKMLAAFIFVGVICICSIGADRTFAYPPFLKQIKELGYDAKDCTFCHEKSTGGKGWNKRGLWLKEQKKERKAPVVDVRWLKGYNPDAPADQESKKDGENKTDQEAKQEKDNKESKN